MKEMKDMVLTSAYLPPVSWFAQLRRAGEVWIEACEHYHKQTIRNRCVIDSPNGPLALSIPVDKGNFAGGKCLMRDVRISRHSPWQRQHWYALESSYFNSPFFEYLQDDFRPIYEREWTFLMDFNEALTVKCCELIDIQPQMRRTEVFMGVSNDFIGGNGVLGMNDGSENNDFIGKSAKGEYYQVFAHKHGFIPDLSIIDLIFNMGPEAIFWL